MTFTITLGYWLIPALLSLAVVAWAVRTPLPQDGFPGAVNVFALFNVVGRAACVACALAAVWGIYFISS